MSWANPWAAWFLALIPAVILLYFLKLKRQEVVVSSTLLWSRALQDRRVNSPFQRLIKSLLLFLQILAILVLVGALAAPEYESTLFYGRTHILLLDCSASMGSQEGSATRHQLAQDVALDYLAGIPSGETAVLIRFARRAQAVTPVTEDFGLVERAIRDQEVLASATRIDEAMELALSIARNQQDAVGVVFSDGQLPRWGAGEVELPLEFRPIGVSTENSGIVALATRMDLSGSGRPQVFVEVRNFGTNPVDGFLSISLAGEVVRAADAALEPGGKWSQSFEAPDAGLVEVLWEPDGEDALVADNRAWVEIEAQREIRVWRTGEQNFLLDAGLDSIPFVAVREVPVEQLETELAEAVQSPDVVVWERAAPESLPEQVTGHLFMGAIPPGVWEQELEEREYPEIVSWDRSHPVNRFLYYNNVEIAKGQVLPESPITTSLVDIRGGSLISTFLTPTAKGVVVGFDSLESTWHTDLSYSLFLHNALVFASESEYKRDHLVRGEELLVLRAPRAASKFQVERPDGRTDEVAGDDGWLRYSRTDVLGPYRVSWQELDPNDEPQLQVRQVPVNLLSSAESEIEPQPALQIAGRAIEGREAPRRTRIQDLWPWLLALALALLLVEWFCFHRR